MPDIVKISALPAADALDGSEQVPVVQDGTTKRASAGVLGGGAIRAALQDPTTGYPTRPDGAVVFYIGWDDPEIDFDLHPYDVWVVIGQVTDPGAPAAPTALVAVGGNEQVSLSWVASSGADGHRVWRNTSDDFGTSTQVGADLGPTADSLLDETVTNGIEYWYWVTAFNTEGESPPSAPDTATPVETGALPTEIEGIDWHTAVWAESIGVADAGSVGTWDDLSGNANDFTDGTANPAIFRASVANLNNRAAVEMTRDTPVDMRTDVFEGVAAPFDFVIVLSSQAISGSAFAYVYAGEQSGTGNGCYLRYTATTGVPGEWTWWAGSETNHLTETPTAAAQVIVCRTGSGGFIRVNGDESADNPGTRAIQRLLLNRFGNLGSSGNPAHSFIAFAGFVATPMTSQEIADVESWAAAFYDITLAD